MNQNQTINIPLVNNDTLIFPQYLAQKTKRGYKLVNPLTKQRHLAMRNKNPIIKVLRKSVSNTILLEGHKEEIPLSQFSKADREKLHYMFNHLEFYKDKPIDEKLTYEAEKRKPRGRPEHLPKNIQFNSNKQRENNDDDDEIIRFGKRKRRNQPKRIIIDDEEDDDEQPAPKIKKE